MISKCYDTRIPMIGKISENYLPEQTEHNKDNKIQKTKK